MSNTAGLTALFKCSVYVPYAVVIVSLIILCLLIYYGIFVNYKGKGK